jgi:hypothetical protein
MSVKLGILLYEENIDLRVSKNKMLRGIFGLKRNVMRAIK